MSKQTITALADSVYEEILKLRDKEQFEKIRLDEMHTALWVCLSSLRQLEEFYQ